MSRPKSNRVANDAVERRVTPHSRGVRRRNRIRTPAGSGPSLAQEGDGKPERSRPAGILIALLLVVMPALQVGRVAVFAFAQCGLEHDSGWCFGVARNLAEHGVYATSTNIATTSEPVSDGIHYWPTVQDGEGYMYFPPEVTIGPGFVIPEALVLKVTGYGLWQYRLLPMGAMLALLVLLSALAYARGGVPAVLVLQLWFWLFPQITFSYTYEAFSEHLALLYSLVAFGTYAYAVDHRHRKLRWWWITGLFLALAYLTKTIYVSAGVAIAAHLAWRIVQREYDTRQVRQILLALACGFLLPVCAFEAYRFVVLASKFGLEGYLANNVAYALIFRNAGSGISAGSADLTSVLPVKLRILGNLGLLVPTVAWAFVIAASALALRRQAADFEARREPTRTILIVGATKAGLVLFWFLLLANSRFTRHAWDVLILLMLLSSIGVAVALRWLWQRRRPEMFLAIPVLLLALGNLVCLDLPAAEPWPRLRFDRVMHWFDDYHRPLQYVVFAAVFQKDAQEEVVQFLRQHSGRQNPIYYLPPYQVAELPPLVGSRFYSIERFDDQRPTFSDHAYLVLGPFQIGDWPWRVGSSSETQRLLDRYQKLVVLKNNYYAILELPQQWRRIPEELRPSR